MRTDDTGRAVSDDTDLCHRCALDGCGRCCLARALELLDEGHEVEVRGCPDYRPIPVGFVDDPEDEPCM